MNTGFQHRTRFIVRENDSDVVKSFEDFNENDTVVIKDKDNNYVEATIQRGIKEKVMYRVVLSNKKYIDKDETYYDFRGHHYTKEGIPFGLLENAEDDSIANKRKYTGVGYAIIEKFRTVVDESVDTSGTQVGESLYAYSLYDYNDTLIINGLTLKEVETIVESLSKISHEELNLKIKNKELIEEGVTHHVNATPVQKWFLSDGHHTMFLREGDMLYDKEKYNPSDPSISGYTWYVDDITVHRAMEEYAWTIDTDSFQLEHGFCVGN